MPSEQTRDKAPSRTGGSTESDALLEFNQTLVSVIESTISALLGSDAAEAILHCLENHFSTPRSSIPLHLQLLREVLETSIGFIASRTVERAIARTLCSRLKVSFSNSPSFTLIDHVEDARRSYVERLRAK